MEEVVESTLPTDLTSKGTVKWVNSIGTTTNIPKWISPKAKSRFSKLVFLSNKGEWKLHSKAAMKPEGSALISSLPSIMRQDAVLKSSGCLESS